MQETNEYADNDFSGKTLDAAEDENPIRRSLPQYLSQLGSAAASYRDQLNQLNSQLDPGRLGYRNDPADRGPQGIPADDTQDRLAQLLAAPGDSAKPLNGLSPTFGNQPLPQPSIGSRIMRVPFTSEGGTASPSNSLIPYPQGQTYPGFGQAYAGVSTTPNWGVAQPKSSVLADAIRRWGSKGLPDISTQNFPASVMGGPTAPIAGGVKRNPSPETLSSLLNSPERTDQLQLASRPEDLSPASASLLGAPDEKLIDGSDARPAAGSNENATTPPSASGSSSAMVADPMAASMGGGKGHQHAGGGVIHPPIPPLGGPVGSGAKNDPKDVKVVQELLNAAIDNEELSGNKLQVNGIVDARMLEMMDSYRRFYKQPWSSLIDKNSPMLRQLAANRLVDPRWNEYDAVIRREVDYYNKVLMQKYPQGFKPVDWRLVKAMLWTEVEGPDVRNPTDWRVWPLQIGRRKGDPGMNVVKYGRESTREFVPQELRDKLQRQPMNADLNIRAGTAYLFNIGARSKQNVVDGPALLTAVVTDQDSSLEKFAQRNGTTVEQLKADNPALKGPGEPEKHLIPGKTKLEFHKAHLQPGWDWNQAAVKYNSRPTYGDEVQRNYAKIKRKW